MTPVMVDGTLYALIAVFGAITAGFTTDEAYKYINPAYIFWIKTWAEVGLAAVSALKMFRSTSYSDHLDAVKNGTEEPPKNSPAPTNAPNSAPNPTVPLAINSPVISTETTAKPTTLSQI